MSKSSNNDLIEQSILLLKQLISTPSISRDEAGTAKIIEEFLQNAGVNTKRVQNNVIARNQYFDSSKPTILLNSHHDTVKPNLGYTLDPFTPVEKDGKLYGLGSNDAGGCLVSLIATFLHFYLEGDLAYNLCLIASAEEEVSGRSGIEEAYKHIESCEFAIVGEPTKLDLAVAEKGLMVLDCEVLGRSGHAAREEGDNAIYKAFEIVNWFRSFQYPKVSDFLGPIKMSVTQFEAGSQHNVVRIYVNLW